MADPIHLANSLEKWTSQDLSRDELITLFQTARPRASFADGFSCDCARNEFIRWWEMGATLSAAEALVPEGWGWTWDSTLKVAHVSHYDETGWHVWQDTRSGKTQFPAMAIVAACLRVRAAQGEALDA